MQTFSTNAASLLLEKDRRTVTKAMLGVTPDAKVNGQARWRLRKFVDALAALERPAAGGLGTAGANPPEYARFDEAFRAVTLLPTLPRRRAAAVETIPLLHAMMAALRLRGNEVGEDPDVTCLRADRVYQLALIGFQGPCEWNHEQVWKHLNIDTDTHAA
jgi:hypothetical protein